MKIFLILNQLTLNIFKVSTTVVLVTLFFACSKDDGNGIDFGENDPVRNIQKSEIIGEWSLYSLIVYSTFDFDQDGIASNELIDQNDCFSKLLRINEDGTFFLQTKYFLDINNNEIHDFRCINSIETGNWILYKNELLLQSPTYEFRIRIRVLGTFLIMEDTVPEVIISEIFELVEEDEE